MGEHEKPTSFLWWQKLTAFLQEYLDFSELWQTDEVLPEPHARICLYVLLHEGIFSDAKDLQKQAYEDYGILIPEEMMEAVVTK